MRCPPGSALPRAGGAGQSSAGTARSAAQQSAAQLPPGPARPRAGSCPTAPRQRGSSPRGTGCGRAGAPAPRADVVLASTRCIVNPRSGDAVPPPVYGRVSGGEGGLRWGCSQETVPVTFRFLAGLEGGSVPCRWVPGSKKPRWHAKLLVRCHKQSRALLLEFVAMKI